MQPDRSTGRLEGRHALRQQARDDAAKDIAGAGRRQRSRANMMAWMLGALAILFFLITIAKMQIFQ